MLIDKKLLDELTAQAKASPRLRKNLDLRDSEEDDSQRMLNAIEPGTVIPIHRHCETSEDVIILRGKAEEVFFNSKGKEIACFPLSPNGTEKGTAPAIHVPMKQYHTCRSKESGTVIIEFKNKRYDPEKTEDLLYIR